MAISNELSSDVAAAILAAKDKQQGELNELKETILRVHATLRDLEAESRSDLTFSQAAGKNNESRG